MDDNIIGQVIYIAMLCIIMVHGMAEEKAVKEGSFCAQLLSITPLRDKNIPY